MKEQLTLMTELMEILGYEDERSVKTWCKKYNIPIIKLGVKKYIPKKVLEDYISASYSIEPKQEIEKSEYKKQDLGKEVFLHGNSEASKRFLKKIGNEKNT